MWLPEHAVSHNWGLIWSGGPERPAKLSTLCSLAIKLLLLLLLHAALQSGGRQTCAAMLHAMHSHRYGVADCTSQPSNPEAQRHEAVE